MPFNPNFGGMFAKPQKPAARQPVTRTVRTSEPMAPGMGGPQQSGPQSYGSASFDPTYQLPGGGTYNAARPRGATGITGGQWNTPKGLLSTPGENESFWDRNKSKFDSPTAGERTMADASGIFRNQSNAQTLYNSGNQGLNTWYDRELQKRQTDLENRMSAAGVFGSGATAKAMYELQGELGASQARDMADLAVRADQSELQRGQGLLGAGQGMHGGEMGRLALGGALSGQAQDRFTDRVHKPLEDERTNARDLSGIFSSFSSRTADEQAGIFNDIVQSIIAEGTVDAQEAVQQAEDMFKTYGIVLKGAELYNPRRTGGGGGHDGVLPGNTYT